MNKLPSFHVNSEALTNNLISAIKYVSVQVFDNIVTCIVSADIMQGTQLIVAAVFSLIITLIVLMVSLADVPTLFRVRDCVTSTIVLFLLYLVSVLTKDSITKFTRKLINQERSEEYDEQ